MEARLGPSTTCRPFFAARRGSLIAHRSSLAKPRGWLS
jgi:hypothetical protein